MDKCTTGFFSEIGAMVNHSCCPNLAASAVGIPGSDGGHDELQLILQAVRDIAEGEELTVDYLGDLYLPFPERDERLREMYGFGAERRPTDPGLESMAPSAAAKSAEERAAIQQRVIDSNAAACDAWDRAQQLRSASSEDVAAFDAASKDIDTKGLLKRAEMLAASHYAAVLNANFLAETHAWRFNATWRLATLLARDGPPKACAQALQLWESALRCGLLVWPSAYWPEHRRLLRGAIHAARGAGEGAKEEEFARKLAVIDSATATDRSS